MWTLFRSGGWPTLAMGLLLWMAFIDMVFAWRARGNVFPSTIRRLGVCMNYGSKLGLLGTVYGMSIASVNGGLEAMAENIGVMLGTTMLGIVLEFVGALGLSQCRLAEPTP